MSSRIEAPPQRLTPELPAPARAGERVRDDGDALLINTANGQILQVEYGVFG
ncbi:MAG TPA: hypothetical protein VMU33_12800 [Burkholderiaceae bacterium]|nr:hypothetical protein [Burkholderiaceae bacterium]